MTTTTTALEREADLPLQDPPALTSVDRVALSLGTQLILWGERNHVRRAARVMRAEQARITHAAARASAVSRDTFERRTWSGPTW